MAKAKTRSVQRAAPKAKSKSKVKPKTAIAKPKLKAKSGAKAKIAPKPKLASKAKIAPKAKPARQSKAKTKAQVNPKLTKVSSESRRSSRIDLRPTGDRILVRRLESMTQTAGGLFIPDSALEKPNSGVVVAVGRGRQDKKGRIRPFDVKPGDRVLFNSYAGTEVELEGDRYLIIRETELLGVETAS